jgi:hypothetical protein
VEEEYSSGAACTVPFLRALSAVTGEGSYTRAADRAWRWTLENPCVTLRWQGMYEDVGALEPYGNLENWDALDTIRLLCRDRERMPGALDAAKTLNRWVEDQFVVFGPADYPPCAHGAPLPSRRRLVRMQRDRRGGADGHGALVTTARCGL